MRTISAAIAIVLMSCLAACTSAGEPDAVVMEEETAASEPRSGEESDDEPTTSDRGEPEEQPTTTTAPAVDVEPVADKVLTLDELPPGWTEQSREPDRSGGGDDTIAPEADGCLDGDVGGSGRYTYAGATFAGPIGVPQLEHRLSTHEGADAAMAALADLDGLVERCDGVTDTLDQVTSTIRRVTLDPVPGADAQTAFTMSVGSEGRTFTMTAAVVVVDRHLSVLTLLDVADADVDLLAGLSEAAVARIRAR